MSRAARARSKRGRIQPYAWLGAGAVTLGLGAAMVAGTAVAFADTGADSSASTTSAASESAGAPASATESGRKKSSARAARTAAPAETPATSGPAARTRASVPGDGAVDDSTAGSVALPAAAAVAVAVPDSAVAGASVANSSPSPRGQAARHGRTTPVEVPVEEPVAAAVTAQPTAPAADIGSAPAADSTAPAAAVPAPAANSSPSSESWLPDTPIVPGAHVELALQQIAAAQGVIQNQTWGSGNIIAGLAAVVPQVFLAGAALSLTAWQATNPGAQDFLAAVAGIPIVAQVAQLNLIGTMLWPGVADLSLAGAQLFLPVVGWFGAPAAVALASPLIAGARENGTVYAVVPVSVKLGTQPVSTVSINGGRRAPLLVDTGASGIVVLPSVVPNVDQLTNVGSGVSCFSGGLCYHFETYETSVDFGGGAVADAAYVNVVTDNADYPDSVENFQTYFSWGADGIVGVGANTAGPGPAPIPNSVLPGELSDGVLVWQNLLPFGLGGVMIFGPNALPTRVSLAGAPDAYVKVSVNGAALTDAGAIIDSGGVFGTLPLANAPAGSVPGDDLPAGTKISVYAPDGTTLLYTFTTRSGASSTPIIDSGLMNTGNAPYQQNPIYLNYAAPDGIGSTDFSIW